MSFYNKSSSVFHINSFMIGGRWEASGDSRQRVNLVAGERVQRVGHLLALHTLDWFRSLSPYKVPCPLPGLNPEHRDRSELQAKPGVSPK